MHTETEIHSFAYSQRSNLTAVRTMSSGLTCFVEYFGRRQSCADTQLCRTNVTALTRGILDGLDHHYFVGVYLGKFTIKLYIMTSLANRCAYMAVIRYTDITAKTDSVNRLTVKYETNILRILCRD